MPPETLPKTPWNLLAAIEKGDPARIRIEDFENTRFPKDENPQSIEGEVVAINESPSYQAGEVVRLVKIGDVWEGGCYVDVIDTSQNQLFDHVHNPRKSLKAWRPHPRPKDRRLLGRVTAAEVL